MGVTTHTCNAIIWKGEAGKVVQSHANNGSQPRLHESVEREGVRDRGGEDGGGLLGVESFAEVNRHEAGQPGDFPS